MLLNPQCHGQNVHGDKLLITPLQASVDESVAYSLHCRWLKTAPTSFPFCDFGADSSTTIALLGNSHANPYLEPLTSIANSHGWGLRTYLASGCDPTVVMTNQFSSAAARQGCLDQTIYAISDMKQHGIRLVVLSARAHQWTTTAGATKLLDRLAEAGIEVLVIRDVPRHDTSVPDCIATNMKDLSACDISRAIGLKKDPYFDAAVASANPAISTLDLTDAICDTTTCYAVVGGVIVYFDEQHMTTTFTMTLRTPIETAITSALGR